MEKAPEELLKENNELLKAAQMRATGSGYDIDKIQKASLDYIDAAKGLKLNAIEFYMSLGKAKELVSHSLSISVIPDITADDAKV